MNSSYVITQQTCVTGRQLDAPGGAWHPNLLAQAGASVVEMVDGLSLDELQGLAGVPLRAAEGARN